MMNQNQELIKQAKATKSPEELMALAKENNMEMTMEEATAYFQQLHMQSGELSDDELDNVAGGGCCTKDGKNIVSPIEVCSEWRCKNDGERYRKAVSCSYCYRCEQIAYCSSCKFCIKEEGVLLCDNPVKYK